MFSGKARYYLYLWLDEKKKKFHAIESTTYPVVDKIYSVLSPPEK